MTGAGTATAASLAEGIADRERVLEAFFAAHAEEVSRAAEALAQAFTGGGWLYALGSGAAATDAAHVAVEFMHPVIVGKRALPALALGNDPTGSCRLPADARGAALGICHADTDPAVAAFLASAGAQGLLTISLSGPDAVGGADLSFAVPSRDPAIVQEVQETVYHVLWELVHVFGEHPLEAAQTCVTCGDVAVRATVIEARGNSAMVEPAESPGGPREEVATDLIAEVREGDLLLCHAGVALERLAVEEPAGAGDAGFLYPFLDPGGDGRGADLAIASASAKQKAADAAGLRRGIDPAAIAEAGREIGERLASGGRLFAFGNGGSATDAQDLAADCATRGLGALCLTDDVASVTAIANDVGFENAFARQLIALGTDRDVALGISTSGASENVLAGLAEGHRRGMLTCAISGYGGGRLVEEAWLDHLLAVRGDYVPRVQEAQATIYHLLLECIAERT